MRSKILGGDCYQRARKKRELNEGIGWYRAGGGGEGGGGGGGITEELGRAPMLSVPCFAHFSPLCPLQ